MTFINTMHTMCNSVRESFTWGNSTPGERQSMDSYELTSIGVGAAAYGFGILFLAAEDFIVKQIILKEPNFENSVAYNWMRQVAAIGLISYGTLSIASSFTKDTKSRIRHLTAHLAVFTVWTAFDLTHTALGTYKIAGAVLNDTVTAVFTSGFAYALYQESQTLQAKKTLLVTEEAASATEEDALPAEQNGLENTGLPLTSPP